jgi:calcium permeable stress-gated cation channel
MAIQIIYEPKVKYHVSDKRPPRISDNVFGWIPLVNTKMPELVNKIGLDTVAFFRFLRMFRYPFSFTLLT